VPKKGFEIFIQALGILHQRGIEFRAILGGGGEEEDKLRQQIANEALGALVSFPGWVEEKEAFFQSIDIFVLPSHHEPFGIVLIEALGRSLPVVSTASEGPREIIATGMHGMLCELGNAQALADQLQAMIADASAAQAMGKQAAQMVRERYSPEAMAGRLKAALQTILTGN